MRRVASLAPEPEPDDNPPVDRLNVCILIFDGVEVLDFAAPFEVFSRTRLEPGAASRRSDTSAPFEVFTVAPSRAMVVATGGPRGEPTTTSTAPPPSHRWSCRERGKPSAVGVVVGSTARPAHGED